MTYEIALMFGLIGTAGILIYLQSTIDPRHSALKFFFICLGLGILIIGVSANIPILEANNNSINNITLQNQLISNVSTAYWAVIGVLVFTILYFIIMLIMSIKVKQK
jgi:hypothetical protein